MRLPLVCLLLLTLVAPAGARDDGERVEFEGVLHRNGKVLAVETRVVYRLLGDTHERYAHLDGKAARFVGRALPGQRKRSLDGLFEQRLALERAEPIDPPPAHMLRLEGLGGYLLTDRERRWLERVEDAYASDGGASREELQELAEAHVALSVNERLRLKDALMERGGDCYAFAHALPRPPLTRKERAAPPPPPLDLDRYRVLGGRLASPAPADAPAPTPGAPPPGAPTPGAPAPVPAPAPARKGLSDALRP
ncbi:MAG: hypothetical protein AB7N76_01020 [Planctomycetota bacterium]